MTKAMGRRMPVAVAEGKKRPHEPVQAAKFASEAGVIIRDNTNMEALRAQPVAEGETRVSSVQVVSQVLPKNSSNSFLKSVGIKPVGTSQASSSSNEIELREQLAAEAKAAVQDELEDLKKRSEEAEEKLARTERELEEMKKLTEINTKAMEENNALLKRILSLNNASST
uniref:Uncharacterized protein n=1 Tax=Setaria italica TaxID=4555 RepID=K3ZMD2_SETIT